MEYRSQVINNLDLFNADPGLYVEKAVKDFVLASPLNCIVDFQNKPFFGDPVLSFADGDSPIFKNFKQTVSGSHFLPRLAAVFARWESLAAKGFHRNIVITAIEVFL